MAISKYLSDDDLKDLNSLLDTNGYGVRCAAESKVPYSTLQRIKVLGRGDERNITRLEKWVRKNRKLLITAKSAA